MGLGKVREERGLLVARVPAPAPPPAVLLGAAGADDRPFVLASGPGDPALCAWSYGGLEPIARVGAIGDVPRALAGFTTVAGPELPPFAGGAVGYAGYDGGWALQPRPRIPRADPLGMPASSFAIYDAVYARSEVSGEGLVIAQPGARPRFERLRAAVARAEPPLLRGGLAGRLAPRIEKRAHLARIEEALALIAAGEIYQVNLTYPLEARYRGSPAAAFLRLLAAAPPFASLIAVGAKEWIVSASPECFFDLDATSRTIAVYPIKGTRPRSAEAARDAALARELLADEKERAEHLMIVDLLRNDLGRFAAIGSVDVRGLCYVESFPRVHHLTSRVVARVPEGAGLEAVMRGLFPGGSITGVPKLRAMEVIDTLEGAARGVYTGAIAYVTPGGSARASIAIRTAQISGETLRFGVGGGIVADSDPEREWVETEIKASALAAALLG